MLKQSVLILAMALTLGACTTKKLDPAPVGDSSATGSQGAGTGGAGQSSVAGVDASQGNANAAGPQGVSQVVYFDFDSFVVRASDRQVVEAHARFLQANKNRRVTLEGNTDERGSREYNLGLGERRGNAVQGALSAAGASSSQLNVTSYGEERPVCRQHDESCWSKNRRVEIVYTAK